MAIHFTECAALTALPPAKKLALMACCDSADKDSRVAMPGFDTIQQWSGLKRSQAYEVIAELVELGYLARRSGGRSGRRAEFYVFPGGGCCPMHAALPDWVPPGQPVAAETPEDVEGELPIPGSGGPDPAQGGDDAVDEQPADDPGSGEGSGSGSGLDRTPSRLPTSEEPPNPPANRGAKSRCRRHGNSPGANCRRCGTSPRGEEQRLHREAVEAAAAEVARIERDRAELPRCAHPDCGPDRWRSPDDAPAFRCPDCHPDEVIGWPTTEQRALASQADQPPRAG